LIWQKKALGRFGKNAKVKIGASADA